MMETYNFEIFEFLKTATDLPFNDFKEFIFSIIPLLDITAILPK